jgi:hypothetical protein
MARLRPRFFNALIFGAVDAALWDTGMIKGSRRAGRLFYLLISVAVAVGTARAQAPGGTIIRDVVYRADGTPAGGNIALSWPAFTTADNHAVAAGSMNVALGADGELEVTLWPTEGASPAGAYYKAVFQLNEAIASREIADEDKFRDGLGKIIDGVVQCLNASAWAKGK